MEAFLSTLPPYVHEFLDKYPPTDVFNLLKELICFAVLYSEDRERINQSTEDFLKKRKQQLQDQQVEEEEAVVPESNPTAIEPIKEETETEIKSLEEQKPTYNVRTGELIHTDNTRMPNTFPEWWGHHEAEPAPVKQAVKTTASDDIKSQQTVSSVWISWENNSEANHTNHHRMERARSQIIPDLRSYLEDDKKVTSSRTAPNSSTAAKKRHSMLNLKTSTSPVTRLSTSPSPPPAVAAAVTKASHRLSASICHSPVTSAVPSSKFVQTAAKKNLIKTNTTPTTGTLPARSASLNIKQPRQNAAMRARAEHARLQQEELERKKNAPAIGTSSSLRLKQRANSGIDWSTIKQERRRTIAEVPKTE